jgi:hypothetical protein
MSRSFPETISHSTYHSTPIPGPTQTRYSSSTSRYSGIAGSRYFRDHDDLETRLPLGCTEDVVRPKVRFSASSYDDEGEEPAGAGLTATPIHVTTRKTRRLLPTISGSPPPQGAQGGDNGHRRPYIKPATYEGSGSWLDYYVISSHVRALTGGQTLKRAYIWQFH